MFDWWFAACLVDDVELAVQVVAEKPEEAFTFPAYRRSVDELFGKVCCATLPVEDPMLLPTRVAGRGTRRGVIQTQTPIGVPRGSAVDLRSR